MLMFICWCQSSPRVCYSAAMGYPCSQGRKVDVTTLSSSCTEGFFFRFLVVFYLQREVPLLAVSVFVLQAVVHILRHLCPCSASLRIHNVFLFFRRMCPVIICVLLLQQILPWYVLFVLHADAMHNNVVCPRSAVGYLHVMCSCSAGRYSHENWMCSCSTADVSITIYYVCCYSRGGCFRDVFFVLQENVTHVNIMCLRSEAGYFH